MTASRPAVGRRAPVLRALGACAVLAVVGALGLSVYRWLRPEPATTVLVPVYDIEARSLAKGSNPPQERNASILGLGIGNIGALQAPVPVDVDGDLLPDVEVAVNLVNAEGVFNNPPEAAELIAPGIEVNRLPTAPLLSQGTPPLRVNVVLTAKELETNKDTKFRFGYDTGKGGSIPPEYKAVVATAVDPARPDTLIDPFKTVHAKIDTTGGYLLGLDPGVRDFGVGPASHAYEGPLTTFASVDADKQKFSAWSLTKEHPCAPGGAACAAMRLSPMPNVVGLTYTTDDKGQHVAFAHSHQGEVDVDLDGHARLGQRNLEVDARVDRLPREITLDTIADGLERGSFHYKSANADGRLPDVRADLDVTQPGERPLHADLDIEAVPKDLTVTWNVPPGVAAARSVEFTGSGQGIGAIEARIANFDGAPTAFTPHVPSHRQYASVQAGPGGLLTDDTLATARLERIRHAKFEQTETGALSGLVEIGDGELPLEVHGELDLRAADLPAINATTVVTPLPDRIAFSLIPPDEDQPVERTRFDFEASESVDVDLDAALALPGTPTKFSCGGPDTFCADLGLRHVPAKVSADLVNLEGEMRFELDAPPRAPAGAPLDVFADVTLGPISDLDGDEFGLLAAPINAKLDLHGVPSHISLRTVDGPGQILERAEFHTCERDWAAKACNPGTESQVGDVAFRLRNFTEQDRPADFPAPAALSPLHATVTGRGVPGTNKLVRFEATGRMTDIKELQYLNVGELFGVRADAGGNKDFQALVDIDDVDLNKGDPVDGRVNVDADVRVTPLRSPMNVCFAQDGRPLSPTPTDPITKACESPDPFADGSVKRSPLALAYETDSGLPFDVSTKLSMEGDLPFPQPELPIGFGEFARVAATADLQNVPGRITALVQTPSADAVTLPDGNQSTATRIRTLAPGASNLKMNLSAEIATAGDDCDDARLPGGGSLVCANVSVDGLPDFASILADTVTDPDGGPGGTPAVVARNLRVEGCDFDFYGTKACRPGTTGEVGVIDADVRVHAGEPSGVPAREGPADAPHVVALADVESLDDLELVAGVRLEKLRNFSFAQNPEGFDFTSDLGDGSEPLTVYAHADLRDLTQLIPAALRAEIIGDIAITPLPRTFKLHQSGPGKNQSGPTELTVDASSRVHFLADAQIREVGSGPECGDHGTACARLEIQDIPETVRATIGKRLGPLTGNTRDSDTAVDLALLPDDPAGPKPNVFVDVAVGVPADVPVVGESPLFADFDLIGAPRYVSTKMEGVETVRSVGAALETTSSTVERFQFHTCQRNYASESCNAGTEGKIDLVELGVRTFDLRPTDFPAPSATTAPLYAGVSGRGRNLEAILRIPDISEVQFLNRDGVTAAKARVGGTTPAVANPLQVRVDIQDLPLPGGSLRLGDVTYANPVADLTAAVDITPFPGDVSFCLRDAGREVPPGTSGIPFTAICEDPRPFGNAVTIDHTPLSIGFQSNVGFDVAVEVDAAVDGTNAATGTPADRQRFVGSLDLDDVPALLKVHFLEPKQTLRATPTGVAVDQAGPFRALVDAPGATSGLDLTFSGAYLVGNQAICKDPRPTVSALCVSGRIENLPTRAELFYDPGLDLRNPAIDLTDAAQVTNFIVRTDGPAPTTFHDLELSSVEPTRNADGSLASPPRSDVLVATADLTDIPHPFAVHGTLDLPDETDDPPTAVFAVQDGKTLPAATVHVQNYIAPDPTVGAFVPTRPVQTNALATHEISAIQRGDAFRLDASVPKLRGAGIRAVRDTLRKPIGTTAINVDFARDFNVRAFVDLQPDAQNRIIGDALIENIPASIDICVRGPRQGAQVGAVAIDATWCDSSAVAPTQGAFEFDGQPQDPTRKINIDAFARVQFGGGSSVLAGRVNVDGLPQVLRATLPSDQSEDLHFQGFSRTAGVLVPDGIDRIAFEAATFDLATADTGYAGPLPYAPKVNTHFPFPARGAPADGREFVHAAASIAENDFHARGQIGRTDGSPSSQLEEVLYQSKPCPTPLNNPPDYPRMPVDTKSKYKCLKVVFDAHSAGVNPLSLHAEVLTPTGQVARLRDAGLSDIPDWIQLTLAETETFTDPANKRGWRRPCGRDSGPGAEPAGASCMPPLLRFDQPDNPHVFGVAELGTPGDLAQLDAPSTARQRLAPNFSTADPGATSAVIPTGTGWDGAFANDEGIRLKALDFDNHTIGNFADDRLAARALFRLPIPQSLTLDQIQTYDNNDRLIKTGDTVTGGEAASDFRFRLAIRNSSGAVVDKIGELAGMLHLVDTNAQLLLTKPCDTDVVDKAQKHRPANCAQYTEGVDLPGEAALTLYKRETFRDLPGNRLRTSTFVQADGRISTPISIGARLVANGAEVAEGIRLGDVEAAIRNLPSTQGITNPDEPSFRLRAEMLSDDDKPKPNGGSGGGGDSAPPLIGLKTTVDEIKIRVNSVFAGFDFSPTATDARRIDAVIYKDGMKIGADIAGYTTLTGNTLAPISAGIAADVDPLDFHYSSHLALNYDSDDIKNWLEDELGAPGWLSDAIGWLVDAAIAVLNEFLASFPLQADLESGLLFQTTLDKVGRFTLRDDLIKAAVDVTDAPGVAGTATVGPVNLDLDVFEGGLKFRKTFDIPDWIDWIPFVPNEITIDTLLAGYSFDSAATAPLGGALGPNVLLDFRRCADVRQFIPFTSSGFDNAATIDGSDPTEDFLIWPGTDPRMSIDGILLELLFGGSTGTAVVDALLDIAAGPVFCNAIFDTSASRFQGISTGTSDLEQYNPGNGAVDDFAGHPVPGQPGAPASLPAELPAPTTPEPAPAPPAPSPGPTPAPAPPPGLSPLYSGAVRTISAPVSLCGVHEFDALTVNAAVTVATVADATNALGTGPACPAGAEGTLQLRANNLVVNPTGSVAADATSSDVPNFAPDYTDYRATGSSGGTNAGVGFVGAAPDSGARPYQRATVDIEALRGGPGSSIPSGYNDPDLTNPVATAGAGGKGGGAVVLRADASLVVNGSVSANGGDGAGNTSGTCDPDPDDNGVAGRQSHDHDGDPETPPVLLPLEDPTYEHTGFHGAGGGAGGAIVLEARRAVTLDATKLSARGGNGGSGILGNGGGGGGGIIKVLAPIPTGADAATLQSKVVAGVNGTATRCAGIDATANPTDNDGQDDPAVIGDEEGTAQQTNGAVVVHQLPLAQLQPYGPFWWPTSSGATRPLKGYLIGGGGPTTVTVVTCAARLPLSAGPPSAGALAGQFLLPTVDYTGPGGSPVTVGTFPTLAAPCGSRPGSTIVELDRTKAFTGAVAPPAAASELVVPNSTANVAGYYGLYTTAVRPRTAGNNCLSTADDAGLGITDSADCLIEKLGGVEWIVGVDPTAPSVSVAAPAENQLFVNTAVTLDLNVADQAGLSGMDFVECRLSQPGGGFGNWFVCHDGQTVQLQGGDGTNTIEVRAYDRAGNRSATAVRNVKLDQNAPNAVAATSGGTLGGGGWFRAAPSILISGTTAAVPSDRPYAYRFDNGLETLCPVDTTAPITCTVPASEVAALSAGQHTFHFTAINAAGVRRVDDNDPKTPSPMHTLTLKLDAEAPQVALTTVPAADQTFGGQPWFDQRPFVVVSAVDQFGGSGVASVEYRFGLAGPFLPFNLANPPVAPNGITDVCFRATDVAGNVAVPPCQTLRVDDQAPSLTLTAAFAPNGTNGWYTSAPGFSAGGYDDGSGVGAVTDRIRTRFDNAGFVDCDPVPACTIAGSSFATGRHLVHASATDRFGNRSGERTVPLLVDLEAPTTTAIVTPGVNEGDNGWWHSQPWVTLWSVDPGRPWGTARGSGIARIEVSLNGLAGPFTTYTDSFQVGAGHHELCFRAVDVAGNTENTTGRRLEVDVADPTTTLHAPAPPAEGWHVSPVAMTVSAADALPGSGVQQTFDPDLSDLCTHRPRPENPLAPSGICVSVDRGPFVPLSGPLTLAEGVHSVRSFSVDVSGRRSQITEATHRVDRSAPAVEVRFLPPAPATGDGVDPVVSTAGEWWRRTPRVVLRATDGQQNSGVRAIEHRLNGGAWKPYTTPFLVPEGNNALEVRATDRVGRVTSRIVAAPVDVTPAVVKATKPSPEVWVRTITTTTSTTAPGGLSVSGSATVTVVSSSPPKAKLQWEITENLGRRVRVAVVVYDATGNVVRRLDGGGHAVTPGTKLSGFTEWDGQNHTLTGLVPVGIYYYRVGVVDAAGNVSFSNESAPIQIKTG
jgi:hypothetical protein